MGIASNTNETYESPTLREDLQEALISISPTETPFMAAAGTKSASNVKFEWAEVDLAAVDTANRVIEGESAPANDAPTNPKRLANFTQISDKIVEVSHTADVVSGVGDAQKTAKQVYYKLRELKRDMEQMLVGVNVAAATGSSGVARQSASLSAFLRTNVDRGATGANGTLSGTTEGYPDAAATDGTDRALTETIFNTVIADCWDAGAEPSLVLCGSGVKQKISGTFTGAATRYKDTSDKTLSRAIDVYVSDFGELTVVPSRFVRSRDIFILDPSMVSIAYLQKTKQKDLAETGHSRRKMIWAEYGLQVDSEKAHGVIADIDPAL
jgi:hypothetical protein